MKAELLSTDTGIVLCADVWKRVYFPVSKAEGRQTVVIVEKVLFLFVEFEIIVGTADWMYAENTGIQTDGYGFPGKVERESGDFGMAVVKLKTGNPALRLTMELSARNASFHCESCF